MIHITNKSQHKELWDKLPCVCSTCDWVGKMEDSYARKVYYWNGWWLEQECPICSNFVCYSLNDWRIDGSLTHEYAKILAKRYGIYERNYLR